MREQAGVIQAEVRSLLTDVGRLDERAEKLQQHFDQASQDVRNIRISAEKVVKRGERIEEMQLETSPIEETPLPPPAQRLPVD
jgi:DNA recombination protein RmuC